MKKIITRLCALILCTILVLNSSTESLAAGNTKVTLNKKKITLYVGKSTTLKVKGTKKKVKWSTSKKSVATVNSKGKVTAKKAGKATITAQVSGKKYKCKVTVKNPYLNKKKVTLTEGKSIQLKLNGTGAKSWTSSNKKVATVNSKGKVTAKKSGSAIITCKGKNGKKYTCKVVVTKVQITSTPKPTITIAPSAEPTSIPVTPEEPIVTPEAIITLKPTTVPVTPAVTLEPTITSEPTKAPTITPEHVHNYISVITKEATCTEDGMKSYTCSCGDRYTEQLLATGHDYEERVNKEATCTEPGTKSYVCKTCGEGLTENLTELGHDYEVVKVVESTCKEKGYTIKKCNRCEEVIYDEYTEVIPHDYEEKVTKEPTCTKVGVKTFTCKECGTKYEEAIPAIGHSYEEEVIKEPTCLEEGQKSNICKVCEDSFIETIAALGHDYEEVKVVAPTCKEKGYTVKKCNRCEEIIYDDYTNANLHDYEEMVTKVPTCVETGIKICTCKVCGESHEEAMAALGHDYEVIKVVEPTCKERGYTAKKCNVCNQENIDNYTETIPHAYGDGEITEEAGCESEGMKIYTCSHCNSKKKEPINPTGHNYTKTKIEATAAISGYTIHTCLNCQKSYKDEIVEASELKKWNYTLDEDSKTISLDTYIGEEKDIVIYPFYGIGEEYSTIFNCDFSNNEKIETVNFKGGKIVQLHFADSTNLTKITFENVDATEITNLSEAFKNCTSLENIDMSKISIGQPEYMIRMFEGCTNLKTVDLFENLSVANLKSVSQMFSRCSSLESVIFTSVDDTYPNMLSNTTNMFRECKNLKTVDLRVLGGKKMYSCAYMFYGCSSLEKVELHEDLLGKVKDNVENTYEYGDSNLLLIDYMFYGSSYTLDEFLKNN